MRRLAITLFVALTLVAGGVTSALATDTTTTTRTVERPSAGVQRVAQTETETTETTESKESDDPHYGIISGTVHAIGWVIALPFRIVGGLIRVIF
jgi:hypothetical protein